MPESAVLTLRLDPKERSNWIASQELSLAVLSQQSTYPPPSSAFHIASALNPLRSKLPAGL